MERSNETEVRVSAPLTAEKMLNDGSASGRANEMLANSSEGEEEPDWPIVKRAVCEGVIEETPKEVDGSDEPRVIPVVNVVAVLSAACDSVESSNLLSFVFVE